MKCHHVYHNECMVQYCESVSDSIVVNGDFCCPICRRKNTRDVYEATGVWCYKHKCLDSETMKKLNSPKFTEN